MIIINMLRVNKFKIGDCINIKLFKYSSKINIFLLDEIIDDLCPFKNSNFEEERGLNMNVFV